MLGDHVHLHVLAAVVPVEEGLFGGLGAGEDGRGRVLPDLDAFRPGRLADDEGQQGDRAVAAGRLAAMCPWVSVLGPYSVIVTPTVPAGPMPTPLIEAFVELSWNWWAPFPLDCSRTVHPVGTGAVNERACRNVERRRSPASSGWRCGGRRAQEEHGRSPELERENGCCDHMITAQATAHAGRIGAPRTPLERRNLCG